MILSWFILLVLTGTVHANSYSIVIPKKVVPGQPLPVSCSFFVDVDVDVQVDLLKDSRTPILSVQHTFKNGESNVLVLDIPADLPHQNYYTVLVHGINGVYFFRRHDLQFELALVKESLALFIQTDRALYKPGQTIHFRAFGLFTDMMVDTKPLNITIKDSKQNVIRSWTNLTEPEYGVVEGSLELDTEPLKGSWSILVESRDPDGNRISEETSVTIGDYVLPSFEVTVVMPTFILTSDKEVQVTIKAEYTYGKPLEGYVTVRADLSYPFTPWQNHQGEVMVETNVTINGEIDVTIPLSRIANEYDPYTFVPLLSKLAGERLTIDAIVTESINGQVRHGYGETQFYKAPYMLQFTSDHLEYFKPGLPFRAKLHVAQSDGRPVVSSVENLFIRPYIMFSDVTVATGYRARALSEQRFTAPSSGYLDVIVDVPMDAKALHLLAEYNGIATTLDIDVTPNLRNGSIQLIMTSPSAAINKEVEFNINCTDGIEALQYFVMANDHAVHSGVVRMLGQKTGNFRFNVTKIMQPYAHVVVFYFNKNNLWNADSVYMEINDGTDIFRNHVSLSFNVTSAEPGEHVELVADTGARSLVNVLVVDQRVLLMDPGNDISTQDVTSALANYGPEANYIYNHVPDNILSQQSHLEVLSDVGTGTHHARRQIDCNTDPPILQTGFTPTAVPGNYPTWVPGMVSTPAPGNYPTWVPGMVPTPAPGLTYATGLYPTWVPGMVSTPAPGQSLQTAQRIRSKFPETFVWTNKTADDGGRAVFIAEVPDTITSWVAGAFSVSKTLGLGIADTKASFKSFRPFFVSLNLPYSVVHGEEMVLQANVFNYMQTDLQVRVTLEKSTVFKVILPGQNGTNHTLASQDIIRDILVQAGAAESVFIPILPDTIGQIDLMVKAQSPMAADAVRRQLKVKPEGFEIGYNRPIIITAGDHVTMDLGTAPGTVPGSQIVHISAIGDIMGPSIPNMNNLLRLPTGCGEQTMSAMAPDVYIARYLNSSGQMTDSIRKQVTSYMEKGVQRELNFQRYDGSFSIWGDRDNSGSTWLTAFVLKTFAEVKEYIQVPDLTNSLRWLRNNVDFDGSIFRRGFVHDYSLRGATSNQYSLTAFVLISVLKYDEGRNMPVAMAIIANTRRYLETHVVNMTSSYDLAITSYALQLAGSSYVADIAYKALDKYAFTQGGMKFWTDETRTVTVEPQQWWSFSRGDIGMRPLDIETTAYGLLYLARSYRGFSESAPVLKWLISRRNANGGFFSTQDTVVGLEALSWYHQLLAGPLNLNLVVTAGSSFTDTLRVRSTDSIVLKTTRVPYGQWPNSTNASLPVSLTATGQGSALAQVSVSYHMREDSVAPAFNITIDVVKETLRTMELNIQIYRNTSMNSTEFVGMTVVEVSLPSGFELGSEITYQDITKSSKKLERKDRKIVLYFDEFYLTEILNIVLIRSELVAKTKPAPVVVYNYYRPYLRGHTFFQSKLLTDSSFCDICTDCGC